MINTIYSIVAFAVLFVNGVAQDVPWVSHPSANVTTYGVYHFRKTFDLEKVPEKQVIRVSADNRYNLFVNGQRVCYGPAKGDLKTYKYDVIDIAPFLNPGKNVLAAQVYNGGIDKPMAFISSQTAFMLQAEDQAFRWLNTSSSWKVFENPAYRVISYQELIFDRRWFNGFYACGGGDEVFADKYPWGWETLDFDDSDWLQAEPLTFEKVPWNLVPRNIPFMDNYSVHPVQIREVTGFRFSTGAWDGKAGLTIPANTHATVLIDFGVLTTGYPELFVDKGAGSSVQIKYAEALYEKEDLKAHRDSVKGKTMYGVWDIFHPDGKAARTFRPLWKRTFRYVQLVVKTKDQSLDIVSFENEYSGYPYLDMATFTCNDPALNKVFEMSLRTFRLCSGETYYDTPFYEQLSYGGDNCPIAAISTYNSTDDRLLREMLRLYPQSENRETGLFKSAYPSRFDFDMGSWSLAWVQTLKDYYFMRGDSAFVLQFYDNIERVLRFYERHLDERTGMVGTVKSQNFIDWSIKKGNIPRLNEKREIQQSALLTLYFAHTLDCAARLYREIGLATQAKYWEQLSQGIKMASYTNCWDEQKQLFRDYSDREIFSQHTNIMAILCDLVPPSKQTDLLHRILDYEGFEEKVSSYFAFFLFKAMKKTGNEDLFLENLDLWHNFINRGHTTCGETGFASHDRSDCHAWSAHPAHYLLSSVCGIKPADVGFDTVSISPHLGNLNHVTASMPHPKGRIKVDYKLKKGEVLAVIELPAKMIGVWKYKGDEIELKPGINKVHEKFVDK